MGADFSGYVTKAGLVCTDGRTITPEAFQHQDGIQVPLVWQHGRKDVENVLGHVKLEHRADGIYGHAYFNETPKAQHAKLMVQHKDVDSMSIFADRLIERAKQVYHGVIHEVSLVMSGANPGAKIDFVAVQHSEGDVEYMTDEAYIYTGETLVLEHADSDDESDDDEEGPTVREVYDSMTDAQKDVVAYMVTEALSSDGESDESAEHSDDDSGDSIDGADEGADNNNEDSLNHQEGTDMTRNVFEQDATSTDDSAPQHLTHAQLDAIVTTARQRGSFKEAFLQHAVDYGIENIDLLFPDYKNLMSTPEFVSRKMEWVKKVWDGTRKTPFARIKSLSADITHDEARARGYIKGNLKKEEWFSLQGRETNPGTVYKKQKLDRDDIIDITDLDVVAWLKAEMRVMLDEELSRAILIGDGRPTEVLGEPNPDKIDETKIRPIATDSDFYNHKVIVPTNVDATGFVEAVTRARQYYRGIGNPTMFTTEAHLSDLLLAKDRMGRYLYDTEAALAAKLRVSSIVPVPVMEGFEVAEQGVLLAIFVNMSDYTVGANKGGAISMFDDFDIDYNQFKYLIETRLSGALFKFKTAMSVWRATGTEAVPTAPTFNSGTGVLTVPNITGVVYRDAQTQDPFSSGAQSAIDPEATVYVEAVPASGYFFPNGITTEWEFTRDPE